MHAHTHTHLELWKMHDHVMSAGQTIHMKSQHLFSLKIKKNYKI